MQKFRNKKLDGQDFSLAHLNNFSFELNLENQEISIEISFSHHCFTEKLYFDRPELNYSFQNELRSFDIERYSLSLKLPKLICDMSSEIVYFAKHDNFFSCYDAALPIPYLIFFTLSKKKKGSGLMLHVKSAYIKNNQIYKASAVSFKKLALDIFSSKIPVAGKKEVVKAKQTPKDLF